MRARLQSIAFAALYGPAARIYDKFTTWLFGGEWSRWQDMAASYLPPHGPIVELGSGTGALAHRAAGRGQLWICLDISRQMIRVIDHRGGRDVALVRADARALPIASKSAGAMIATFPSSFILDRACQREIIRVLLPGGRLVVLLSAHLTGPTLSIRWRRTLLSTFYGRSHDEERISELISHFRLFDTRVETVESPNGAALILFATPKQGGDESPPV